MKVTVFGIGYVGLVQAAVLAEVGHDVMCVDVDQDKVDSLKKGIIPIYEPGLTQLVTANHDSGRLMFTTDAKKGTDHGSIIFIAVGTPPDEDGSADLKYVLAVANTIAESMESHKVIVNKSTVPVCSITLAHDLLTVIALGLGQKWGSVQRASMHGDLWECKVCSQQSGY